MKNKVCASCFLIKVMGSIGLTFTVYVSLQNVLVTFEQFYRANKMMELKIKTEFNTFFSIVITTFKADSNNVILGRTYRKLFVFIAQP